MNSIHDRKVFVAYLSLPQHSALLAVLSCSSLCGLLDLLVTSSFQRKSPASPYSWVAISLCSQEEFLLNPNRIFLRKTNSFSTVFTLLCHVLLLISLSSLSHGEVLHLLSAPYSLMSSCSFPRIASKEGAGRLRCSFPLQKKQRRREPAALTFSSRPSLDSYTRSPDSNSNKVVLLEGGTYCLLRTIQTNVI